MLFDFLASLYRAAKSFVTVMQIAKIWYFFNDHEIYFYLKMHSIYCKTIWPFGSSRLVKNENSPQVDYYLVIITSCTSCAWWLLWLFISETQLNQTQYDIKAAESSLSSQHFFSEPLPHSAIWSWWKNGSGLLLCKEIATILAFVIHAGLFVNLIN